MENIDIKVEVMIFYFLTIKISSVNKELLKKKKPLYEKRRVWLFCDVNN